MMTASMDQELRTIRLYGKLGSRFGRVHRLAVNSLAEAVRALCVLLPGFEQELMGACDRGIAYTCYLGQDNLDEKRFHAPAGDQEIRIAPVIKGAKRGGLFQVVLGAALIGLAFVDFGFAASTVLGMKLAGAGLLLAGIFQMISPMQQGLGTEDRPENKPSYNFNGPVNTTAQGNAIPLGYGRKIVGSAVVSAGIYSEDQM